GPRHEPQQALQQLHRCRRAAADHEIDRKDLRDRAHAGIAACEHAAPGAAVTRGDDPLRRRHGGPGALEGFAHVERHRPGDEQHVGVAGRGHEACAESLDIVQGVGERVDLELAAVDRKSTRLNSSHGTISYAVFCLKKNTLWHYTRSGDAGVTLLGDATTGKWSSARAK